jgi:hypothetical protein
VLASFASHEHDHEGEKKTKNPHHLLLALNFTQAACGRFF